MRVKTRSVRKKHNLLLEGGKVHSILNVANGTGVGVQRWKQERRKLSQFAEEQLRVKGVVGGTAKNLFANEGINARKKK